MKCDFCNNDRNLVGGYYDICTKCFQKHWKKAFVFVASYKWPNKKRAKKVIKLRLEKKSYREIGETFGISASRARQIFMRTVRSTYYAANREKSND